MITPNEACTLAEESEMKTVQEVIRWAAETGRHEVYMSNVSPGVKRKLQLMGYKLNGFWGIYHIKWRKPKC